MGYRPGEVVILFSTKDVKKIVESEIIGGVEIYYMDDSTSYASTQIFSAEKFLIENMENICMLKHVDSPLLLVLQFVEFDSAL